MKINRVDYDFSNGEHRIMVNGYETLVGHYETKQRALEVLDEIQIELSNYVGTTVQVVYEMPQE